MQIEVQELGSNAVVSLTGDLTGGSNDVVVEGVVGLLDKGVIRIVLDLSHVGFVGSLGIGDLVRIVTQANTLGGRVILAGPTPFVAGVLKTTKLDKFFEICATTEEATARLK
jgi:anti-sigma B factor antagonist